MGRIIYFTIHYLVTKQCVDSAQAYWEMHGNISRETAMQTGIGRDTLPQGAFAGRECLLFADVA